MICTRITCFAYFINRCLIILNIIKLQPQEKYDICLCDKQV